MIQYPAQTPGLRDIKIRKYVPFVMYTILYSANQLQLESNVSKISLCALIIVHGL